MSDMIVNPEDVFSHCDSYDIGMFSLWKKFTYCVYVVHEKSQYPDLTDYLDRSDISWLEVY